LQIFLIYRNSTEKWNAIQTDTRPLSEIFSEGGTGVMQATQILKK